MKRKMTKLPRKTKILIGLVIILAAVFMALVGIATVKSTAEAIRLHRIEHIYADLHLSSKYQQTYSNVFGEKRPYSWDKGRTFSSEEDFVVGKTVSDSVAEVRKTIENEGFVFFEAPYAGATFTELHFKSSKGAYIRLNVSSKPRDDALRNASLMGLDTAAAAAMDANAGPANVVIKVNLDDNNE